MLKNPPSGNFGRDLRVLRKQRGMTLTEVSGAVGRSVGWLSQVERDISAPAQDELELLAKALNVSLSTFTTRVPSRPGEKDRIVRKNARRLIERKVPGVVEELISPDLTDDFEMLHSTFAPGAERTEMITRPTQEAGFIVSGQLEITVDGETFTLTAGDSFRIRGEPFGWANRTKNPCVAIWVIAPPVY